MDKIVEGKVDHGSKEGKNLFSVRSKVKHTHIYIYSNVNDKVHVNTQ